jgi:hypothetical protein
MNVTNIRDFLNKKKTTPKPELRTNDFPTEWVAKGCLVAWYELGDQQLFADLCELVITALRRRDRRVIITSPLLERAERVCDLSDVECRKLHTQFACRVCD